MLAIALLSLSQIAFTQTASARSDPTSVEECFSQKDFSLNLFYKNEPTSVSKEGCRAKVVLFRGQGNRWNIDVCNPQIGFRYSTPLDADNEETLAPGSSHCPDPLFGIDIGAIDKNAERFQKARGELWEILNAIRKESGAKIDLDRTSGQLLCLERVLETYLDHCRTFVRSADNQLSGQQIASPTKELSR